jgi:hypothetical protein
MSTIASPRQVKLIHVKHRRFKNVGPASCTIFVNFRANFMKFFHFHEDLAEDYQNPTSLKDVQYFKHLCSRLRVHKFISCKMYMVLSWANTSLFGRVLRTDHPCLVIISYIGSSWGRAIVLGANYFDVSFVFSHPGPSKPVLRWRY